MKLSVITVTYNRPVVLENKALRSLMDQQTHEFEWVVVNDGNNPETRLIVENARLPSGHVRHVAMEHDGFGLCKGRNLALSVASGDFVAYLDDDNEFKPNYVDTVKSSLRDNPTAQYLWAQQVRKRQVVQEGVVVKTGKEFVLPATGTEIQNLANPENLFDSNGFAHRREGAPKWNEGLWIYPDYEYLLSCNRVWGDRFLMINEPLVDYVQSNEGQVGQSNYGVWSRELRSIWENRGSYPLLSAQSAESWFPAIVEKYGKLSSEGKSIPGFRL